MGQLHELLAVLPSLKGTAAAIAQETEHTLKSKPEHFHGIFRKYSPLNDAEEDLAPPPDEEKPLTTTVGQKLSHFWSCFAPFLDAAFQVDCTNMRATSNLAVYEEESEGGGLFIQEVPSTFLLQLDKRLSEIRRVFQSIPTLDPGAVWEESSQGEGILRMKDPQVRYKTKKALRHKEVAPATKEHKAQVQVWNEDVPIGRWEETHFSGRMSVKQKHVLLDRLDRLQIAVRKALSRANQAEHETGQVSKVLFKYLFDGMSDVLRARVEE